MADITMCKGKGCQKKYSCYRHSAEASKFQSYFIETPLKGNECEYFIHLERFNKWKNNILK